MARRNLCLESRQQIQKRKIESGGRGWMGATTKYFLFERWAGVWNGLIGISQIDFLTHIPTEHFAISKPQLLPMEEFCLARKTLNGRFRGSKIGKSSVGTVHSKTKSHPFIWGRGWSVVSMADLVIREYRRGQLAVYPENKGVKKGQSEKYYFPPSVTTGRLSLSPFLFLLLHILFLMAVKSQVGEMDPRDWRRSTDFSSSFDACRPFSLFLLFFWASSSFKIYMISSAVVVTFKTAFVCWSQCFKQKGEAILREKKWQLSLPRKNASGYN